jgi:hypothetical protein
MQSRYCHLASNQVTNYQLHKWLNYAMSHIQNDSAEFNEFDAVHAETPSESIICVDCGGNAHLLTNPPEDGVWQIGEIVAYRCSQCRDRWDIVLVPEGE